MIKKNKNKNKNKKKRNNNDDDNNQNQTQTHTHIHSHDNSNKLAKQTNKNVFVRWGYTIISLWKEQWHSRPSEVERPGECLDGFHLDLAKRCVSQIKVDKRFQPLVALDVFGLFFLRACRTVASHVLQLHASQTFHPKRQEYSHHCCTLLCQRLGKIKTNSGVDGLITASWQQCIGLLSSISQKN